VFKSLHGTTYVFDYITAISKTIHDESLSSITFDEIHHIIKTFAIRVQATREIEAGKKWRDYRKKSQEPAFMREAADKTVSAMIRWGFLEGSPQAGKARKIERSYRVKPRLQAIGHAVFSGEFREAKLMIFDRILRMEKESAFTPQLLVKIRDSTTKSIAETEYGLPTEGVIQFSAVLLKSKLGVGQVDFRMIVSWFEELELLNGFNPRVLDVKEAEEIYPTSWVATEAELLSFYSQVAKGNYKTESLRDLSCSRILEAIGALKSENDQPIVVSGEQFKVRECSAVKNSLLDPYGSKLVLIGEGLKFQGLISREIRAVDNMYLLLPTQPSFESFVKTLSKYYNVLRMKWKTPYVWISPLRALCCRSLMISDELFDDLLTQFYKRTPESMEFSKSATGIFRKRVRIFEKPFKLYGNPFRMIRLVENV